MAMPDARHEALRCSFKGEPPGAKAFGHVAALPRTTRLGRQRRRPGTRADSSEDTFSVRCDGFFTVAPDRLVPIRATQRGR